MTASPAAGSPNAVSLTVSSGSSYTYTIPNLNQTSADHSGFTVMVVATNKEGYDYHSASHHITPYPMTFMTYLINHSPSNLHLPSLLFCSLLAGRRCLGLWQPSSPWDSLMALSTQRPYPSQVITSPSTNT